MTSAFESITMAREYLEHLKERQVSIGEQRALAEQRCAMAEGYRIARYIHGRDIRAKTDANPEDAECMEAKAQLEGLIRASEVVPQLILKATERLRAETLLDETNPVNGTQSLRETNSGHEDPISHVRCEILQKTLNDLYDQINLLETVRDQFNEERAFVCNRLLGNGALEDDGICKAVDEGEAIARRNSALYEESVTVEAEIAYLDGQQTRIIFEMSDEERALLS